MIAYCSGDILETLFDAIVIPVNCVGVMGKGLALSAKKKYPKNYEFYQKHCHVDKLPVNLFEDHTPLLSFFPGTIACFEENDKVIVNFTTKNHWRNPSKLKWIRDGIEELANEINYRSTINEVDYSCAYPKWKSYLAIPREIKSIAIPKLGCGLGGLKWKQVAPIIESLDDMVKCDIGIYTR